MILRLQYRSFGSTARSSSKAKFFAGFFKYHVGVFDGKTLKTYVLSRISILSLTFLDQLITRRSGVAQNKTIDYRFIQALSPKQGVCRAECIEAMADDYATGPGQTKNLRSLYDYDRRRGQIKGVIQGRKQGVSEASPALRTETTMFSSGPFKSHLLGQSKPWYYKYQGSFFVFFSLPRLPI
jgi:hypothetical protein